MLIQEFKHKLTLCLQDLLNSEVKLLTSISALIKRYLPIYEQMQATDRIKDRTKPQTIQTILLSAFIRPVAPPYQKLVTNIYTISHSRVFQVLIWER